MPLDFCGDEKLAFQCLRDFSLHVPESLAMQLNWQLGAEEIETFLQKWPLPF